MTRNDLTNFLETFELLARLHHETSDNTRSKLEQAGASLELLIYVGSDEDFGFAIDWTSRFLNWTRPLYNKESASVEEIADGAEIIKGFFVELEKFVMSRRLEWQTNSATSGMPTPQTDA